MQIRTSKIKIKELQDYKVVPVKSKTKGAPTSSNNKIKTKGAICGHKVVLVKSTLKELQGHKFIPVKSKLKKL